MTSRELIAWSARHEQRAHPGWWRSRAVLALALGAALAAWVAWRGAGGWLAAAIAVFGVAFLRIPFHIYWRADAALLAQLPIDGVPLFDAAIVRCARGAAVAAVGVALGAVPLFVEDTALGLRCLAFTGALAASAAWVVPAIVVWSASWVALDDGDGTAELLRSAAGVAPRAAVPRESSSTVLGAVPGGVGAIAIVLLLLVSPWLRGGRPDLPAGPTLGGIAVVGALALIGARRRAGPAMGKILRDVSALDRQRLASLEIRPPTAIEAAIARAAGSAAALPYRKLAVLVRRRYPLAFALGALVFATLAGVGLARPADPAPWLAVVLGGTTAYGVALAGRLRRPPLELPRLAASLPIPPAAQRRARLAWLAGWWGVFVVGPALFAALRQPAPGLGLGLLAAGTLVVALAGARR